jgi:uncharacterized damage-inducible protein DinB
MSKDPSISLLLEVIDEAYDVKSWHGTNLRGSIRGMDAATAAWRPGPERHNVWEVVCHVAYWKYIVRRRLTGEERGSFPLKGSNWFVRPSGTGEASLAAWKADVALLAETHSTLREAVAALSAKDLPYIPPKSKVPNVQMVRGVAAHDLYHAGQIQLLKRLRP